MSDEKPFIIFGAKFPDIEILISRINLKQKFIHVLGYVDDNPNIDRKNLFNRPLLGGIQWLSENVSRVKVVCTVGRTLDDRRNVLNKLDQINVEYGTLIDPESEICNSKIGKNVLIFKNAIVGPNARISDHTIVSFNAIVGHDSEIGENNFLSGGVTIPGGVRTGTNVHFGVNSSCIPGISLGSNIRIGANAAVMMNAKDDVVMIGNPARPMKKSL